jgi:hypothetical protein
MRNGQPDIGLTQAVAEKTDSAEKNPSNGRLFISYAREDLAKAQWLKIELRKSGYNIDYDANIETGKKYPDDIYARIQDCDKLIVLWSKSSIGSLWVCVEVAWAHGHVFPIVIDEKDDEGQGIALPDPFQHDHAENLTIWNDGVADPVQFRLILAKLQKQVKVPERVEEYFGFYANYAKELQDLIDNLTASRPKPTIVYGPLGAGKNTLCIKALNDERVVDTYKRCIYPVDLSDPEDIQRVAALTAEALGIKASIEPGAKHQSKLIAAIKNEINETPSILFFKNAQKCLYTHEGNIDVGLLREFFGDIKRSCESCKSVFIITILGGQNLAPHFHCERILLPGLSV